MPAGRLAWTRLDERDVGLGEVGERVAVLRVLELARDVVEEQPDARDAEGDDAAHLRRRAASRSAWSE